MGNGIGLSLYALGAMRVERRLRRVFSKSRWVKRCKFRFALALSLCVAVSSVPGRDFLRAPPSPARLEQDTLSTHQRDCIVNCTSKPRNSRVHVAVVILSCSARLNADSNLVFAIGRESHRVKVHPFDHTHFSL